MPNNSEFDFSGLEFGERTKEVEFDLGSLLKQTGKTTKEVIKGLARGYEGSAALLGATTQWAGEVVETIGRAERNFLNRILPHKPPPDYEPSIQEETPNLAMRVGRTIADFGQENYDFWVKESQRGFESPDPEIFRGKFMENPSWTRGIALVAEAVPSLATATAITFITKSPVAGAAALGLLEGSNTYKEARLAGEKVLEASALGGMSTVGTTILENIPLTRWMKGGSGWIPKDIFIGAVQEGGEEVAQAAWNNMIARLGYDETRDFTEGMVEGFIGGAGSGGLMGGITSGRGIKTDQQIKNAMEKGVPPEDMELMHNVVSQHIAKNGSIIENILQASRKMGMKKAQLAIPGGEETPIIPEFKNTEEAMNFGIKNAKNDAIIEELKRKRKETLNEVQKFAKEDATDEELNQGLRLSTKAQFYREALEAIEEERNPKRITYEKVQNEVIKPLEAKGHVVDITGGLDTRGFTESAIEMDLFIQNNNTHTNFTKEMVDQGWKLVQSFPSSVEKEYSEIWSKEVNGKKWVTEITHRKWNQRPREPKTQISALTKSLEKKLEKTKVKQLSPKKLIRQTTGQHKISSLLQEHVALKQSLQKFQKLSKQIYKAGQIEAQKEIDEIKRKIETAKSKQDYKNLVEKLAAAQKASKEGYRTGKIDALESERAKLKEYVSRTRDRQKIREHTLKMINDINKLPTQNLPLKYKELINEIKAPFDLKRRTNRTLARRGSMRGFVDKMLEQGHEISIPPEKLDMLEKVSLNVITYDELIDVHDTIMRLYHQGKLFTKLLTLQTDRSLQAIIEEAWGKDIQITKLDENSSIIKYLRKSDQSKKDWTLDKLKAYVAIHLRPERLTMMLDGWKEGVNHQMLFMPILEAENKKLTNAEKSLKAITEIHKSLNIGDLINKKYEIGRVKGVTKNTAMFVYANSFNDSNRAHLYGSGLTDQDIQAFQDALSTEEKQAVENLIRYYDEVEWSELDTVYSQLEGVRLGKEDHYFPIMWLEEISNLKFLEQELLQRAYIRRAGVEKGMTKARIKSQKGFESFSYFDVVYKQWERNEHYKAYASAVKDVTRYLYNPKVKEGIREKFSPHVYNELDKWIRDVSYGGNETSKSAIDRLARWLRTNYAVSVLGYNIISMAKQPISFLQGMGYLGEKATFDGLLAYMSNPFEINKFIDSKSVQQHKRMFHTEREMREIMYGRKTATKFGGKLGFKAGSLLPIAIADKVTTNILWLGAYRQVMRTSMVQGKQVPFEQLEQAAIAWGDQVVRRTQPMGSIVNLAGVFRGPEYQKMYTLFKNQLNQNFNLTYELYAKLGQPKSQTIGQFIKGNIFYLLLPAFIMGMIKRRRVSEDWRDHVKDVADQFLGSLFIISHLTQDWGTVTPLDAVIEDLRNMSKTENSPKKLEFMMRAIAKIYGIPYTQIARTVKGEPFGRAQDGYGKTSKGEGLGMDLDLETGGIDLDFDFSNMEF